MFHKIIVVFDKYKHGETYPIGDFGLREFWAKGELQIYEDL
jgi:hypothetical protein